MKEVSDISSIGADKKKQMFSKTEFPMNKDNRCFQPRWLEIYNWIEYSVEHDAIFCYPCRQFGKTASKDDVFIKSGFNNWKTALEKNRGFDKHAQSMQHSQNMQSWANKRLAVDTNKEISQLLSNDIIVKRNYYLKSCIGIVKFLAGNELAFRGDYDIQIHSENSLFTSLFEYTVKKDSELKRCLDSMPNYATYKSPKIQNETIGIIADLIWTKIVEDVNSAGFFTLLVDGTKYKNGNEIITIAVRYLMKGKPFESVLSFEKCDSLCAEPIAELIISKLKEYGLDLNKMISQCYDGASVMSGEHGGIQAIIQKRLNRTIPYVHCKNHRLHLVVIEALKKQPVPSQFFDEIKMIHNFFSRFNVKQLYEGTNISKLIETRWTGHKRAVDNVFQNFNEIFNTLTGIKSGNKGRLDAEDVAIAIGILKAIKNTDFVFHGRIVGRDRTGEQNVTLARNELSISYATYQFGDFGY